MVRAKKDKYSRKKGTEEPIKDLETLIRLEHNIPNSTEYIRFKNEVNELYTRFSKPSKTKISIENYIDKGDFKYFVFAFHAEIEYYLEQLALKILRHEAKQWNKKSSFNFGLANLLIYFLRDQKQGRDKKLTSVEKAIIFALAENKKEISEIKDAINEVIKWKKNSIEKINNGIKYDHIKRMLIPLGVPVDEYNKIDSQFSQKLSNIAEMRNMCAHTTNKEVEIVVQNTPQSEFDTAMNYLSRFDKWLTNVNNNPESYVTVLE